MHFLPQKLNITRKLLMSNQIFPSQMTQLSALSTDNFQVRLLDDAEYNATHDAMLTRTLARIEDKNQASLTLMSCGLSSIKMSIRLVKQVNPSIFYIKQIRRLSRPTVVVKSLGMGVGSSSYIGCLICAHSTWACVIWSVMPSKPSKMWSATICPTHSLPRLAVMRQGCIFIIRMAICLAKSQVWALRSSKALAIMAWRLILSMIYPPLMPSIRVAMQGCQWQNWQAMGCLITPKSLNLSKNSSKIFTHAIKDWLHFAR